MTVKIDPSKSFDVLESLEPEADITLARALEEAIAAREATFRYRNEIMEELELFRKAVREDLKDIRAQKRTFDARDTLAGVGLVLTSIGIAVAFHWAYSLIVMGVAFSTLGILTSRRAPVPPAG